MNITLNPDQAEFLFDAMNWWKTSGVNYWSAERAEEILDLLTQAREKEKQEWWEAPRTLL